MNTTYASLALTEQDHQLYEKALEDFSKELGAYYYETDEPSLMVDPLVVRNPANTRETVGVFLRATSNDVDLAVARGKRIWREIEVLGWRKRFEIMLRAANLVLEKKYKIAAILTYEAGKTRGEALAEVHEVVAMINNYYDLLMGYEGRSLYAHDHVLCSGETKESPEHSISRMRSLGGPVAVIVPFNFPFALAASMSMAAFLAGNPVIIKPSNACPLSTRQWRDILVEAGMPEEACGFVVGSGKTVGEQLISHPDIACVAFTGSSVVGEHIMDEHFKLRRKSIFRTAPVLEMGGSNPVIVMPSADFKGAAEGILRSILGYSGQKCSATRRVITVGNKTAESLTQAIEDLVEDGFSNGQRIIVGDPRQKDTFLGPLISAAAHDDNLNFLGSLLTEAGQQQLPSPQLFDLYDRVESIDFIDGTETSLVKYGYFVRPGLLWLSGGLSKIVKSRECFSSIAVLEETSSLEKAVIVANDTFYGLTAGIFSQEKKERDYFFEHIEAGSTYANRIPGATTGCWPGVQTFGGWKGSGSTGRNAFGKWYLLNFLREQNQTEYKKKT